MTDLSRLLTERLPPGMSARGVAREAQRKGYDLRESTATSYFYGRHAKHPRRATLEALAAVLPVTLKELQDAADLPRTGEPWEPNPDHAAALDADQRRVLDQLLSVLARQEGRGGDERDAASIDAGDEVAGPEPDYGLAARRPGEESQGRRAARESDENQ